MKSPLFHVHVIVPALALGEAMSCLLSLPGVRVVEQTLMVPRPVPEPKGSYKTVKRGKKNKRPTDVAREIIEAAGQVGSTLNVTSLVAGLKSRGVAPRGIPGVVSAVVKRGFVTRRGHVLTRKV